MRRLALLFALCSSAPAEEWRFGAESIYGLTGTDAVVPGFGLGVHQGQPDAGWIFDAGLYVILSGGAFVPVYFHPGYQFSPHWRIWAYVGAGIVPGGGDVFDGSFPLILNGAEGEWLPLAHGPVQIGVLAGMPFAYFFLPLFPYVGARLQIDLSDKVRLQTVARTFLQDSFAVLGSVGLQIRL